MKKPQCYVCQKPIDEIRISENYGEDSMVYVCLCHGEKEVYVIPNSFFLSIKNLNDIEVDSVFLPKVKEIENEIK